MEIDIHNAHISTYSHTTNSYNQFCPKKPLELAKHDAKEKEKEMHHLHLGPSISVTNMHQNPTLTLLSANLP